jgi:hypothetical protein
MMVFMRSLFLLVVGSLSVPIASRAQAENVYPPPRELPVIENVAPAQDQYAEQTAAMESNPLLWQQYQALQTQTPVRVGSGCGCGGYPYDRCGCNLLVFPWIGGPGLCDSWCVGPKWAVEADGMFIFRDDADWDSIIADVGLAPDLIDQFDHALGTRLFVTGYNSASFGMQVGYEGMNDWHATARFPQAGAVRTFDYETRLNSVEINFLPNVPWTWKFFSGLRYIEIDENFRDFTSNDKPIPAPANPPAATVAVVDTGLSHLLENRLIGFQLGGRRDNWKLGRWISLEAFANAGVYCNLFKRENVTRNVTTIITGDDLSTPDNEFSIDTSEVNSATRHDFAEIAFAGEAGITSVTRLTQCVALRCGYQLLVIDGMGQGLDAYFVSDLQSSTVLYHGLQFGLEYRR